MVLQSDTYQKKENKQAEKDPSENFTTCMHSRTTPELLDWCTGKFA